MHAVPRRCRSDRSAVRCPSRLRARSSRARAAPVRARARVCTIRCSPHAASADAATPSRTTRASEELSSFTMRMQPFRAAAGHRAVRFRSRSPAAGPFFRATSGSLRTMRRHGHDRAGEERPHEEAALWSRSSPWSGVCLSFRNANRAIISSAYRINVNSCCKPSTARCWRSVRRNGRQFELLNRLEADDREGLVRRVCDDLQIRSMRPERSIREGQARRPDADQVALFRVC